jgi:hypothetical protein
MTSTSAAMHPVPDAPGAADEAMFAALETAFGDELKDVLTRYIETSDRISEALQDISACAHWQEAARLALQIGSAAADMGFRPITKAARAFADDAYKHTSSSELRNDAQTVVFEYERMRMALERRFPELVADGARSVA